jgi:ribosomal protein S18 acetylase RimI-like enzyme
MMNDMKIQIANEKHLSFLQENDTHISKDILITKIQAEEILIMEMNGNCIGWLRYSLFWDEIPFMNMLYFFEDYRQKGYGKILVDYWEKALIQNGYKRFLTSTLANEDAQHFYRKMGYRDIGSFILPLEPLEIILMKDITLDAT